MTHFNQLKTDELSKAVNKTCKSCTLCNGCSLIDLSGIERAANCNRALDKVLEYRTIQAKPKKIKVPVDKSSVTYLKAHGQSPFQSFTKAFK